MARTKTTLSLDPDAALLLEKTGNASAYLSAIVHQRWRAWQEDLATLAATGWTAPEIFAALDALNGLLLHGSDRVGPALALEMHDAARLNGTHTKHGATAEAWAERVAQVRDQEMVARALWTVSQEFWAGNDAVEQAIQRLRPAAQTTT